MGNRRTAVDRARVLPSEHAAWQAKAAAGWRVAVRPAAAGHGADADLVRAGDRRRAARRRGPGGTSADVHQRDRRQDRRRHGGPHVDVPGRQRGGGPTVRILISGGSISCSNGG